MTVGDAAARDFRFVRWPHRTPVERAIASLPSPPLQPYLKAGQRCLVPATAFAVPDRNTSKPIVFRWFGRPDGELFYFTGIWREWGRPGQKKAPTVGKDLLYSFLTTAPNGVVEPVHDKAMPVLSPAEAEQIRHYVGTSPVALGIGWGPVSCRCWTWTWTTGEGAAAAPGPALISSNSKACCCNSPACN